MRRYRLHQHRSCRVRAWGPGGFSLIEFLVALGILSLISLGLTQTLIAAQVARRTSAAWMRATQLAEERIEQVRAGGSVDVSRTVDEFSVATDSTAVSGYSGLRVVGVTVAWTDHGPRTFVLRSLVRERR